MYDDNPDLLILVFFSSVVFVMVTVFDFCAFFFDDDLIASYQIFSLWDKTVYVARRHSDSHEQENDDMEPFV